MTIIIIYWNKESIAINRNENKAVATSKQETQEQQSSNFLVLIIKKY